jgi:hypothetical protein
MERFRKLKGLIMGGFMGGFSVMVFMIVRVRLKQLLAK